VSFAAIEELPTSTRSASPISGCSTNSARSSR